MSDANLRISEIPLLGVAAASPPWRGAEPGEAGWAKVLNFIRAITRKNQ